MSGSRDSVLGSRTNGAVLALFTVALLTGGCGDDGSGGDIRPAVFRGLTAYGVLKGTVKIAVEAAGTPRLEVMAGGSSLGILSAPPYSFPWDTSKIPDGLIKLSLREHGGQEPKVVDDVTVVALNRGLEAPYHNGLSSGTLAVPQAGGKNPHMSFTWTMPDDGTRKVLALLFWKEISFHMELSMGVGCSGDDASIAADGSVAGGASFCARLQGWDKGPLGGAHA